MKVRRIYTLIILLVIGFASVKAQFPMGGMNGKNTASAPTFVQPQAVESGYGWLEAEFPANFLLYLSSTRAVRPLR